MKHNIIVSLVKNTKSVLCQIRLRVSFAGVRVDVNTGISYDSDKWKDGKPKPNTKNQNRQSASEVMVAINKIQERIDQYFTQCDIQGTQPTVEGIRNVSRNKSADAKHGSLSMVLDDFLRQHCAKNKIRTSTIEMYQWVNKLMLERIGDVPVSRITDSVAQDFLNTLSNKYKNTTIVTFIKYFKSVARWLNKQCYTDLNIKELGLNLPNVEDEAVVYLLPHEIKMLEEATFSYERQYFARDVFLFCCYTGLRFSDVKKLRKSDVYEDAVHTVTQKTGKHITIELNRKSREIYQKALIEYADDLLLFPRLISESYNLSLKRIAQRAGIDQPTSITYYIGEQRYDETYPKYELMSSHVGRRTFVVNCLLKGIPPLVIIKWTGHKDLSALNPYIAIVDEQRKSMMKRFDKD